LGHTTAVLALALLPDGRSALSVSADGQVLKWNLQGDDQVIKWNLQSDQLSPILDGMESRAAISAILPNGRAVLARTAGGALKYWDLSSSEMHMLGGRASEI